MNTKNYENDGNVGTVQFIGTIKISETTKLKSFD